MYEKRDEAFVEWLEKEHPAHSVHDHKNISAYNRWMDELRAAFNAGWAERKRAVYYAGMNDKLDMGYNKGLSSWTRSLIITYPNAKREILTIGER